MNEMKFYVIEVAEGDSKIASTGMYKYATLDEAVASFHKKMGTAMASEMYTSELLMVINSDGGVHRTEKWVREKNEEPLTK